MKFYSEAQSSFYNFSYSFRTLAFGVLTNNLYFNQTSFLLKVQIGEINKNDIQIIIKHDLMNDSLFLTRGFYMPSCIYIQCSNQ